MIDHQRSRSRRARLTEQIHILERSVSFPGPESAVVERQTVLAALERLSDTDREALLLVGWDGLSHEAAAKVLGMSKSAFTKRLGRARQRFEELVDPTHTIRPIPVRSPA